MTKEEILIAKAYRKAYNEFYEGPISFLPQAAFECLSEERQAQWYHFSQKDHEPEVRKLLKEKYGLEIPQVKKDGEKYEQPEHTI